jgi:carbonic anhydrase
VGAVLEYAIFVLRVPHIIICGHTDCGGINTMINGKAIEPGSALQNWLNHAASVKQQMISDDEDDIVEAIKQNILLQHQNLLTYRFIAQRYHDGLLHIHNWLYDLHSGKICSYDHTLKRWSRIT